MTTVTESGSIRSGCVIILASAQFGTGSQRITIRGGEERQRCHSAVEYGILCIRQPGAGRVFANGFDSRANAGYSIHMLSGLLSTTPPLDELPTNVEAGTPMP